MKFKIVAITALIFALTFIGVGVAVLICMYVVLFHAEKLLILLGIYIFSAVLYRVWKDIYDEVEKRFQ